jgi:hypothetical protein
MRISCIAAAIIGLALGGAASRLASPMPSFASTITPIFADAIIPAGSADGINQVFTVPNAPNPPASLQLYRNGLLQRAAGGDYRLIGPGIRFNSPPAADDTLLAFYRY